MTHTKTHTHTCAYTHHTICTLLLWAASRNSYLARLGNPPVGPHQQPRVWGQVGDDVVIVPLVGLHSSIEDGAGVQRRSEATEARQAGLGPKDGWVVAPQKLLIHLLVLLLRVGRIRDKGGSDQK